jgi:VanZ family protein
LIFSFLRWWGPLLAYMLVIFLVSSASRPALLQYAPDYLWHFVGYFVMGLLAIRAFARGLEHSAGGKAALFGVMLALVYAMGDEWHQSFVPGRVASLQDIAVDALGIVAALAVLYIYWRLAKRVTTGRRPVGRGAYSRRAGA